MVPRGSSATVIVSSKISVARPICCRTGDSPNCRNFRAINALPWAIGQPVSVRKHIRPREPILWARQPAQVSRASDRTLSVPYRKGGGSTVHGVVRGTSRSGRFSHDRACGWPGALSELDAQTPSRPRPWPSVRWGAESGFPGDQSGISESLYHCRSVDCGHRQPAFGRNSQLASKFLNHAAQAASVIAFILPMSVRKAGVENRLHRDLHPRLSCKLLRI